MVGKSGVTYRLTALDAGEDFLGKWRDELHERSCYDFPTIQEIFYVAYEAGGLFEPLAHAKTDVEGPLIWRHCADWGVCFSPHTDQIYVSSTVSEAHLDTLVDMLMQPQAPLAKPQALGLNNVCLVNDNYQQEVKKVKDYIAAGDIFQANIARFWTMPFAHECLTDLYLHLREVNPAPFSGVLNADDLTIVSSSPERLFCVDSQGKISARPIAGTRRRSDGDEDNELSAELLLSEKERAEHIMLLDLERNDLGRVCKPGSIRVDECMVIEKYATVQHIVSNVSGQLATGIDVLDVLKAKFPGGTITGCPKVRCMQIIHEMEPQARGVYTGGMGYIAWDGAVDMNILIRSFWHYQGQLSWAAGAGIVADSIAAHEEIETEHKVAGLLRVFS